MEALAFLLLGTEPWKSWLEKGSHALRKTQRGVRYGHRKGLVSLLDVGRKLQ